MKKLFLLIATLMLMAGTAFADPGSAIKRDGEWVEQYAITDPDNHSGFNNIRLIFSHQVCEVLVQYAGNDTRTRKANLLCWCDPDEVLCPNDDLDPPNEVWREPEIMFLNDIQLAGNYTMGSPLVDLREKEIYGQFWNEYVLKGSVATMVASMVTDGLNLLQQKRALKFGLHMDGLALIDAQSVANNYIDVSPELDFADFGLATMPLRFRRVLKIFNEVGWFE